MAEDAKLLAEAVVIPRGELRQLVDLLSGSAKILEQLLSPKTSLIERRETEETDLEAQLEDEVDAEGGPPKVLAREATQLMLAANSYKTIAAEDKRASAKLKAILENSHSKTTYEQLSKVWVNLAPRRDRDEIVLQRMYLVLLPSASPDASASPVSDVGPLLAVLKRRRDISMPEHLNVGKSRRSPLSIGVALNDLFAGSSIELTTQLAETRMGQVLDVCHQKMVLPPIFSRSVALEQTEIVLNTLQLVDLNRYRNLAIPFGYYSESEVLSMSIQQAFELFSRGEASSESLLPRADGISFRSRELNAKTLREIGRLRIEWTEYLDRHLELDVPDMTLRVFWFGSTYFQDTPGWWNTGRAMPRWILQKYPTQSPEAVASSLKTALGLSYAFLFTSPAKGSSADAISAYKTMPVPWWLQDFYEALGYTSVKGNYRTMGELLREEPLLPSDINRGTSSHIGSQTPFFDSQSFERFGPFEDRVRILDAYMKSKKPSTLRGLWRDRRDSLQWYTLWVVIIFGGLSILIALLGLAITAAQTVATFQQLEW